MFTNFIPQMSFQRFLAVENNHAVFALEGFCLAGAATVCLVIFVFLFAEVTKEPTVRDTKESKGRGEIQKVE